MSNTEGAFLAWLRGQVPRGPSVPIGIGDDCAAIRIGEHELLVTVDMLLDGKHFEAGRHSPEQIGRKAVACSLSDLAAMAARPVGAVVAVGLTEGSGLEYAQRMFSGAKTVADEFGCPIVGGDTTSWDQPTAISVTMLGQCPDGRPPVRRDGARPGDVLYVTGPLGGSILGRHLTFQPRIDRACRLAECCDLHAMIDISDGLALDLHRVCEASGVGAVLDEPSLGSIVSDDARTLSSRDGVDALDHALFDGEDFELLIAMPAVASGGDVSSEIVPIGRIVEGEVGVQLRRADGVEAPIEPRGYEHPL